MLTLPLPGIEGIELEWFHRGDKLPHDVNVAVQQLVVQEGIKEVDETILNTSFSKLVARQDGRLVGHLRQATRLSGPTICPYEGYPQTGCFSEIGSVVVVPEFRRLRVAAKMVDFITSMFDIQNLTPYAVCNPEGSRLFESAGYESVGNVPVRDRVVYIFPPRNDWAVQEQWESGQCFKSTYAKHLGGIIPDMQLLA